MPVGLSDQTTYVTRKPTMWGAHGYGFRMVEPYFPLMNRRLNETLRKWDIRYLLVDSDYVDLN